MNKILTLICLLGFCFVSYSQTPVDSMSKSREYLDSVHKASIDSIRAITDRLKRNQWKIDEYVDKFKDKTGEKFVYAFCTGTFSNTATTNSRLYVGVSLDKNVVRFDLREYGRRSKKDGCDMIFSFKAENGDVISAYLYNNIQGQTYPDSKKAAKKVMSFIKSHKEIKVSASGRGEYFFKIDTTGLLEALEKAGLPTE